MADVDLFWQNSLSPEGFFSNFDLERRFIPGFNGISQNIATIFLSIT